MNTSYAWLMKMAISSKLKVSSSESKFILSLYRALHPDNSIAPPKITIKEDLVQEEGGMAYAVEITVDCTARNFDTLRGTLDEIQTLISSIKRVLGSNNV